METWLRRASRAGATFAVFPEECITGSVNKSELADDAVLAAIDDGRAAGGAAAGGALPGAGDDGRRRHRRAAGTTGGTTVRWSLGRTGYLATYDKMWLPGGERDYFQPGKTLPVVDSQGWRFAVGICADLQRGDYFRLAADAGAEFFPALRGRER